MEDWYHILIVAREYLSEWAEAETLTQATLEDIADIFYEEVICRFGTLDSVAVDRAAKNHEWTDLPLKCYDFSKITIILNHGIADRVIQSGHWPIADALSKLMACSDELKEMWYWPPSSSALGWQDYHQTYDWIFTLPPYVCPRCCTSDWTGEHNLKYHELDSSNWWHSVTTTGESMAAGTMGRWYRCWHTKPKKVKRCQQTIRWQNCQPLSGRFPNWLLDSYAWNKDWAVSPHETRC